MSNADNNPYRADMADEREVPVNDQRTKSSRGGCFLYGCLFSILGVIILGIVVTVSGYYFIKGQITKYTDVDPIAMPEVEMTEEEMAAVSDRLKNFQELVVEGTEEENPDLVELVLTANDINAMIEQNPDFKGRVHVEIEENQLAGQVSIPTDMLPIGQGRYFNATAKFDVSLNNGILYVTLADATVKGTQLPEEFLNAFRGDNLVKDLNNDPNFSGVIHRLESLDIADGQIKLTARPKIKKDEIAPVNESPVDKETVENLEDDVEENASVIEIESVEQETADVAD